MRSLMLFAVAAGLALSGCVAAAAAAGGEVESIAFETGPCFGACPVYRVNVGSDGDGLFEGRRFTAVTGERRFRITPEQFRAFARNLAPLRPASGERNHSGDACASMATDLPSADVTWRAADGSEQRLHFYFGCDMERNRAMAERLESAPRLLPIGELIQAGREGRISPENPADTRR